MTKRSLAALAVSAFAGSIWLYQKGRRDFRSKSVPVKDKPKDISKFPLDPLSSCYVPDEAAKPQRNVPVPVNDGWRVLEPEECLDARTHIEHQQNEEDGWRIAAASLRGKSHAHSGKWREDAFAISHAGGCQIIAVSDGAGSAPFSRIGSEIASRVSVETITAFFSSYSQPLSKDVLAEGLRIAVEQAYAELNKEAEHRQISIRDMACTLLLLIHQLPVDSGHGRVGRVQIGDGAIFLETGGSTEAYDAGDHGVAAGETTFLTSRTPEYWVNRVSIQELSTPLQLGLVATDGIADDFYPFSRHAPQLVQGIRSSVLEQDHKPWHEALTEAISYERRGSFDDRTLVIVAPVPKS